MSGYETISKYQEDHRKLHSSDVGMNAPRRCTDAPVLILFGAVWVGMIVIAAVAVGRGDLTRLTSGVDYLGNVCGQGTPHGVEERVVASWGNRKSLFFPIQFDPFNNGFNLQEAVKFPICVQQCPTGAVPHARGDVAYDIAHYGIVPTVQGFTYSVEFNTKSRFSRCMPDFFSYNCATADCNKTKASAAAAFTRDLGLESTALRSFAEVKSNWWVLVVCSFVAIIVSYTWLFILRRLVKPAVVITLFLVLVTLLLLGIFFMHRYTLVKDNDGSSSRDWYMAAAILSWLAAFLYVCVGIYLWKDIMVACDIIEEASKIPVQMPTMVAVPPVLVLFILPVSIFSILMAAEIYTNADLKKEAVKPLGSGANAPANATSAHFVGENWRTFGQIFNIFVFFWTVGFIHAVGFMVVAFCAVFWYWSRPGDEKVPDGGVRDALGLTFRNHLGSLALGSLIIAIIQTFRVILAFLEKHMQSYIEKSDAVKFLVCCMNCCLAYFQRFVQFINKNAYIVQCLTGESFIGAARHAMSLLVRNALSVGAVNIVGEYVMLIGKVLITAFTILIAYGIMTGVADEDGATPGLVVILISVGILSYFIACVFINVFGVCIDTVLLSYCYDLEQNNGADKPYFCPDDLRAHIGNAERRVKEGELKRASQANLQTRL